MHLIIAIRVLLSVTASGLQKRLALNGVPTTQLWVANYALIFPVAWFAAGLTWVTPPASFWWNSLLGGVLDALGNLAMVAALRSTDLSVFGPLNAIRPILALIFGWIFLGESPTAAGFSGILITVAGTCIVLKGDRQAESSNWTRLWSLLGFRVLGLALGTVGAVFLKRAALVSSPQMTIAGWITCGLALLIAFGISRGERLVPTAQAGSWIYLHAIVFFTMQCLTIRIFQSTLLSYAFVFFQLGMILQVIAGRFFFNEPHFKRRLLGCVVMSAGAALIVWRG